MGLGSGIRKKPIRDPGVKKAPDPGSGSATLQKRIKDGKGKQAFQVLFPNKLVRVAGPEVNPPGIARHQFLKHRLS